VGFEAGSYLRLIDFVYHSTLGLRVIKKKKRRWVKRGKVGTGEVTHICRANTAHIRQSRPDSGLGFQVKVFETF